MRKFLISLISAFCMLAFFGCSTHTVIVNEVEEREANEIVVFLAARKIKAEKIPMKSTGSIGEGTSIMYSISVHSSETTLAMAILNQNGLPRKKGTTLLELFARQGLITTEKEETIRYQAGLEQQLANTIRKIDGVLDADVQLSFPSDSSNSLVTPSQPSTTQRITASIYVKHQGIVDDPNSHLISKIKRLVASAVLGLDINDVVVISDRSRFSDVTWGELQGSSNPSSKEQATVWSMVISKDSVPRFQLFFFLLITGNLISLVCVIWMIWKFYPILKERGGFKVLFNPFPIKAKEKTLEDE